MSEEASSPFAFIREGTLSFANLFCPVYLQNLLFSTFFTKFNSICAGAFLTPSHIRTAALLCSQATHPHFHYFYFSSLFPQPDQQVLAQPCWFPASSVSFLILGDGELLCSQKSIFKVLASSVLLLCPLGQFPRGSHPRLILTVWSWLSWSSGSWITFSPATCSWLIQVFSERRSSLILSLNYLKDNFKIRFYSELSPFKTQNLRSLLGSSVILFVTYLFHF